MRHQTPHRVLLAATVALGAMTLAACGTNDPGTNGPDDPAEAVEAPEHEVPEGPATDDEPAPDTDGEAVDAPAFRPGWLPAQMPLPEGASYSMSLPAATGGESAFYYVPRPVAEVIEEFEALLPAAGWTIVDEQTGVAWVDDRLFTVEGHGDRLIVYAEPMAGSDTETNVIYGPAE